MNHIYRKVLQFKEICYVDTSASFKPLNISITLLYTSCVIETLPLGLFIILDELEITLKKTLNLLKLIFSLHAFFRHKLQRFFLLII